MPTIIKGKFDKHIAEKIYSNSLKGNPAFKPWKGKDGCAWFGYDGDPNPGALARNKPILVEATVDIPHEASRITKNQLTEKLEELKQTAASFAVAEGRLWTWVGQQGEQAASGFLIVEVGKTELSITDGKYLLVNNIGMGKVTLSLVQQEALENKLDHGIREKLTLNQKKMENLHGRIVKLTIYIPKEKVDEYDESDLKADLLKWANGRIYATDKIRRYKMDVTRIQNWAGNFHTVEFYMEFDSYIAAKRNARVFANAHLTLTFKDKSQKQVDVNVAFGQGGAAYKYKATNNVVNPPTFGKQAW